MGYLSCKADSSISATNPSPSSSSSSKIKQFDYSDLEAATNGFSEHKLLGKGSHGYVYKAVVRGKHVAVKKPSKASAYGNEMVRRYPEADNEIEILSKLKSPRLVNLVGFSDGGNAKDRLLVVEFMSNGTLYDVLHSSANNRVVNWGRRIKLALHTAKAIDTLHSLTPPVIHRDVKSANVLIDRNFNARLGDFGLALRCYNGDFRMRSTPPAGTMGYLDPGYVTPDGLSTKTDVFSFGILLLEIISGRKAIDVGYSPPSVVDWAIPLIKKGKIIAVYDPRLPPPRDPLVRKQLALIAAKCVRSCRERRPSMKEVVDWLTKLSKLVPLHTWNGFNNPCMMVETVGRPVESRVDGKLVDGGEGNLDTLDNKFGRLATDNSRRVYSDLGFRSNLMDLMASTDGEFCEENDGVEPDFPSANKVAKTRFGSERFLHKGNSRYHVQRNDRSLFRLRRNQSTSASSDKSSRTDDLLSQLSCSRVAGDV